MNLIEIAPYIRFADGLKITNQRGPSKTYDCRLIYALSGKAAIAFEDRRVELTRCSLVTFQSGTRYTISPEPELSAIVLDFDYTQQYSHIANIQYPCPADRFVPERAFSHVTFTDAPDLNDTLFLPNIRLIENALIELIDEMKQQKPLYQGKCSSILKSIFFDMARHAQLKGNDYKLIDSLIDYIQDNYSGRITNTDCGKALNYNPCYLNRLMVENFGISLHQYILRYRLSMATKLLLTTDLTIAEIAEQTGFQNSSRFSNYFKEVMGERPLKYRQYNQI